MGDCMGLFSKLKDVFKTKEKNNDEVKKYEKGLTKSRENFVSKLKSLSKTDLSKLQYPPNISYGYLLYMKREYLKPDYDPDAELVKH